VHATALALASFLHYDSTKLSGYLVYMGDIMPRWETFKRRSAPVTKQPLVTLQKRGTMSLNGAAYEALGEPAALELLYDDTERLVGFRPVDPSTPHAYAPRRQGRAANYIVSGSAFTKYFDIETDVARRYPAQLVDGVLVVDLKQPGADATGVRARVGSPVQGRPGGNNDA